MHIALHIALHLYRYFM